jgi:hypothetical protein
MPPTRPCAAPKPGSDAARELLGMAHRVCKERGCLCTYSALSVKCRSVDELLDMTIERAGLEQLQVEVSRTL